MRASVVVYVVVAADNLKKNVGLFYTAHGVFECVRASIVVYVVAAADNLKKNVGLFYTAHGVFECVRNPRRYLRRQYPT